MMMASLSDGLTESAGVRVGPQQTSGSGNEAWKKARGRVACRIAVETWREAVRHEHWRGRGMHAGQLPTGQTPAARGCLGTSHQWTRQRFDAFFVSTRQRQFGFAPSPSRAIPAWFCASFVFLPHHSPTFPLSVLPACPVVDPAIFSPSPPSHPKRQTGQRAWWCLGRQAATDCPARHSWPQTRPGWPNRQPARRSQLSASSSPRHPPLPIAIDVDAAANCACTPRFPAAGSAPHPDRPMCRQ